MRHLTAAFLAALLLPTPGSRAAEPTKRWTHGRSSCDPVSGQIFDAASPAVDRRSLERAWEYALEDLDSVSALGCFPGTGQAAGAFAARLRSLEESVLPGVRATSCEPGAKLQLERLALVRSSSGSMRESEALFEEALQRFDRVERQISAAMPAEGLPFDDCRAKAQRGWARARASLNRLSCEVGASLERMDSFRERTEQAGLSSLDCSATNAATTAVAAPANGAAATAIMLSAPAAPASPEQSGYQPFTGAPLPAGVAPATLNAP